MCQNGHQCWDCACGNLYKRVKSRGMCQNTSWVEGPEMAPIGWVRCMKFWPKMGHLRVIYPSQLTFAKLSELLQYVSKALVAKLGQKG